MLDQHGDTYLVEKIPHLDRLGNVVPGVSTSNPVKRTIRGMRNLADLLWQLPKQSEKRIAKYARLLHDRSSLLLTVFRAPLQAYSLAYRTVFRVRCADPKQSAFFARTEAERAQLAAQQQASMVAPIVGYRYRSEAILSEDAAPPSQQGIELLDPPVLCGQPGTRVPHLWVERSGQRLSTLDLLDGPFVLFTGSAGGSWCQAASAVAEQLGIQLAAYRMGPDGDLLDVENGWQARMGVSPDGAVLVRPDGFVAWRSSKLSTTPHVSLEQVLARLLCRAGAPLGRESQRGTTSAKEDTH